jgi:hypothetical protein
MNTGYSLFLFEVALILLEPGQFEVRVYEDCHDIGRIKVSLMVILIELRPAKVDAYPIIRSVRMSALFLRSFKLFNDEVH